VLAPCFATGLVGFVTLLFAGFTCFDVLVYRLPGPGEAKLLYDLAFGLLAMSGMPTAVALAAFAIAAYSHRTFDRSTGHLAAVGAAAHVLLLLSFAVNRGVFSLEGAVIVVIPGFLFLWIAVTGGTLLRQQSQQ
jgi:stage V sporulation protein SpoVS